MPLHSTEKRIITAVILAGGRGRRLGGVDKGLADVGGRPLVHRVLSRIAPQVGTVIINANRHHAIYARFGFEVVSDAQPDYQGPLAGIAAALSRCKTPLLLSVPCDTPCLPLNLAERLYRCMEQDGYDLAVARDSQRIHPVIALLRTELLPSLLNYLDSGERKTGRWIAQQHHCEADFSDQPEAFLNINTPEDQSRLQNR